uniref:Uncharacterized protein n=1 Tax=Anguilla anguilla TaxID=7936 RepID=A0A0E9V2M4_ANGAN
MCAMSTSNERKKKRENHSKRRLYTCPVWVKGQHACSACVYA